MKNLAIAFLVCALTSTQLVFAQKNDPWIEFASPDDYFRVSLPHFPRHTTLSRLTTNYGELDIRGALFDSSASNGAYYAIWVLTNEGGADQVRKEPDVYLDASAELVWEGLMKPLRDKLPDDQRAKAAMTYTKELAPKPLPGREYSVTIGNMTGTTQFFAAQSRVYVLLAMNSIGAEWSREPFFSSFAVSAHVPGQLPTDFSTAPDDAKDYQPVFKSSEVTRRAQVLAKPEPSYTEGARKFSITGTVVLRAVFARTGEVTNIQIIRRLPHGLTQNAVAAARRIKFSPAEKDGVAVSTWIQLEYNFNLY